VRREPGEIKELKLNLAGEAGPDCKGGLKAFRTLIIILRITENQRGQKKIFKFLGNSSSAYHTEA
jgi:hypothetical protein